VSARSGRPGTHLFLTHTDVKLIDYARTENTPTDYKVIGW
jgi:hypothetical protein